MCSRCDKLLGGLCLPHELSACPLRHALYCSLCASYGHDLRDCPDDPSSSSQRLITIDDSEEAMAAFLAEKKVVVPKGRSLRIAMEAYASQIHHRVIYRAVASSSSSKRNRPTQ